MSSSRDPASNSASAASAASKFRLAQVHVALEVGGIQLGHYLALLDHLAFVEQPLFHPAGDLEAHLGLGRLDVAGDANLPALVADGRRQSTSRPLLRRPRG